MGTACGAEASATVADSPSCVISTRNLPLALLPQPKKVPRKSYRRETLCPLCAVLQRVFSRPPITHGYAALLSSFPSWGSQQKPGFPVRARIVLSKPLPSKGTDIIVNSEATTTRSSSSSNDSTSSSQSTAVPHHVDVFGAPESSRSAASKDLFAHSFLSSFSPLYSNVHGHRGGNTVGEHSGMWYKAYFKGSAESKCERQRQARAW